MNVFLRVLLVSACLFAGACSSATPSRGDASAPAATLPAIPRRSGWVTADDGTRLYREVCGQGPAIVFVHGLGGNHAVWFQQVARFARDHTVITLSQRGFAPSDGDRSRFEVERLVRDLEQVMDEAGVARAVVVGQSMGGWTALGLALSAPDRVEALVLADTFGGISDDEIDGYLAKMTAAAAKLGSSPPPLGLHPALSPAFSAQRPDLAYLYQTLATFGSPRPDVIAGQLAASRAPAAKVAAMKLPTLFLVGGEDRLFPPPLIERAASKMPGATVVRIDGAGHSPYFEKPAEWNAALERFLASR